MRGRLIAAAHLLFGPAVLVVLYLILHASFGRLTEDGGLLTPEGSISIGLVMLGIAVILLRLIVLFVVPAIVVYRVVARLLRVTASS